MRCFGEAEGCGRLNGVCRRDGELGGESDERVWDSWSCKREIEGGKRPCNAALESGPSSVSAVSIWAPTIVSRSLLPAFLMSLRWHALSDMADIGRCDGAETELEPRIHPSTAESIPQLCAGSRDARRARWQLAHPEVAAERLLQGLATALGKCRRRCRTCSRPGFSASILSRSPL